MNAHNGKIASLPRAVREDVNERQERFEPSPQLLAWLNALPQAREDRARRVRRLAHQQAELEQLASGRLSGMAGPPGFMGGSAEADGEP